MQAATAHTRHVYAQNDMCSCARRAVHCCACGDHRGPATTPRSSPCVHVGWWYRGRSLHGAPGRLGGGRRVVLFRLVFFPQPCAGFVQCKWLSITQIRQSPLCTSGKIKLARGIVLSNLTLLAWHLKLASSSKFSYALSMITCGHRGLIGRPPQRT